MLEPGSKEEREFLEFLEDFDVDTSDNLIEDAKKLIQALFDETVELRQAIYTMKYG